MMSDAERQRAFRERRAAKLQRMEAALQDVRASLEASNTPLGQRLHAIATEALS